MIGDRRARRLEGLEHVEEGVEFGADVGRGDGPGLGAGSEVAQPRLQPILGAARRLGLAPEADLAEFLGEDIDDVRTELRVARGDADAQHVRAQLIVDGHARHQRRGGKVDALRPAHRGFDLRIQPDCFGHGRDDRRESRGLGGELIKLQQARALHHTASQGRGTQDVDLRADLTGTDARLGGYRLQVAHRRARLLRKNRNLRRVLQWRLRQKGKAGTEPDDQEAPDQKPITP